MKLRKLIWISTLLVLMVSFGILVKTKPQICILPDGSRFELQGTTRSHEEISTDGPFQKQLRRVLPTSWQHLMPSVATSKTLYGNSNTIALWFTLTDATGNNISGYPWSSYVTVDDDGFIYSLASGSGTLGFGAKTYHHLDLEAFPRRQKDFEVRLLDGKRLPIAKFRVKNPMRGPFPEWKTESLPVSHTNGPLAVTLERLDESSNQDGTWVSPNWKVTAFDPNWSKAEPSYHIYEDATGNLGGRLSFREPVWKLIMPFHRHGWKNFSDDEKFVLADLAVPSNGGLQMLQTNFVRQGVKFTVQTLAGVGSLLVTNGTNYAMTSNQPRLGQASTRQGNTHIETWSSTKPFFLIQTSEPGPLVELRFRIVGSDGKELKQEDSGWQGLPGGGGRQYQQKFDVTDALSNLTLEVTVSRARVFEFFVNPKDVRHIDSTNK
ncbi:MAG: hypothetical protein HOP33_12995 [Verrucomicrobia bacterium]|nr:hypothetical protein [Verrucomicrobiota bacterium]